MYPSRRDICRAGVLGAAAVGLAACDLGGSGPRRGPAGQQIPDEVVADHAYAFSLGTFSPHVGSSFLLVGANDARANLILLSATDLGISGRPVMDKGECFALAFEASDGSLLEQNTYLAAHPVLGSFPLFIVPGPPSGRQTYGALFNRI